MSRNILVSHPYVRDRYQGVDFYEAEVGFGRFYWEGHPAIPQGTAIVCFEDQAEPLELTAKNEGGWKMSVLEFRQNIGDPAFTCAAIERCIQEYKK
ncbi:MAG TPA: hypothetical protein VHB72_04555 [Candidatus Saccharimonadales bacterium]|nr:hypothetical protein [Candidatus Saccharimonadales bacterium]